MPHQLHRLGRIACGQNRHETPIMVFVATSISSVTIFRLVTCLETLQQFAIVNYRLASDSEARDG